MKSFRLYVPVYAATMLLSAFLLFAVQPLFGKMILPMLGGAPAVWNTAMVFFQAMLLAGYIYAHFLARFLKPAAQAILHVLALLGFAAALPLALPAGWSPPETSDPALWQLQMMTVAVGGPFFILAATAPLLQHWFSGTDHPEAHNPYFLYAASNIGSLSALVLYPVLFEPLLTVRMQTLGWTVGYGLLSAMIALCAVLGWKNHMAQPESLRGVAGSDNVPTIGRMGLWLLLAFVPSSLMLGVTTYITTDLASAPLLWIVPLALYVGTFIVAFARQWPFRLSSVLFWQAVLLIAVIGLFVNGYQDYLIWYKPVAIALHLGLFTLTALACHMQLAALRPGARSLTVFYLIMSTGGVLGGIFNALLAPQLFVLPVEYAAVLALSGVLRYATDPAKSWRAARDRLRSGGRQAAFYTAGFVCFIGACAWLAGNVYGGFRIAATIPLAIALLLIADRRWLFAGMAALVLILYPGYSWNFHHTTLAWKRNFFGVLRVNDDAARHLRVFTHGTTIHGAQPLDPAYRLTPITYYYPSRTPAGDAFGILGAAPNDHQNIAAIGLGIGSIACYKHEGRHIDFYEIDPDVKTIAEDRSLFTYLSDCGTPYKIIIGDGRLQLAKMPDRYYDMIFLDAFSSDNIPVHLITREAVSLYLQKLKPGGFILMNLSNRHLMLEPVIAADARDLNVTAMFHSKRGGIIEGTTIPYTDSIFAVLAPQADTLQPFAAKGWHPWNSPDSRKAWRDDFSNIVGALRIHMPLPDK